MSKIIDSHELIDIAIRKSRVEGGYEKPDAQLTSDCADYDRIQAAMDKFQSEAWDGRGLQKANQNSDTRGFSAKLDGVEVRTFTTAGRVLITLARSDSDVISFGSAETFVSTCACEDEAGRMGLQGIYATADEVVAMFTTAAEQLTLDNWKPDEGIKIAGM